MAVNNPGEKIRVKTGTMWNRMALTSMKAGKDRVSSSRRHLITAPHQLTHSHRRVSTATTSKKSGWASATPFQYRSSPLNPGCWFSWLKSISTNAHCPKLITLSPS